MVCGFGPPPSQRTLGVPSCLPLVMLLAAVAVVPNPVAGQQAGAPGSDVTG